MVLNNRIRVLDPDSAKEADIVIRVLRPYGYLAFPSVIIVSVSVFKLVQTFRDHEKLN